MIPITDYIKSANYKNNMANIISNNYNKLVAFYDTIGVRDNVSIIELNNNIKFKVNFNENISEAKNLLRDYNKSVFTSYGTKYYMDMKINKNNLELLFNEI